jgi:hypothetical protein
MLVAWAFTRVLLDRQVSIHNPVLEAGLIWLENFFRLVEAIRTYTVPGHVLRARGIGKSQSAHLMAEQPSRK